jgi:hypothetical protein
VAHVGRSVVRFLSRQRSLELLALGGSELGDCGFEVSLARGLHGGGDVGG